MLKKREKSGMKPLDQEKICKILSLKERATREYLKKMNEYKIIRKIKYCGEISYVINPIYFLYGKWLSECAAYTFKDEISRTIINNEEKELFNQYIRNIRNKPEIIR